MSNKSAKQVSDESDCWQSRTLSNVSVSHCRTIQTETEKHFESERHAGKVRSWYICKVTLGEQVHLQRTEGATQRLRVPSKGYEI